MLCGGKRSNINRGERLSFIIVITSGGEMGWCAKAVASRRRKGGEKRRDAKRKRKKRN
jgi:hypothetical protein